MNRYGLLIGLILLLASCRAKPGTAEARESAPTDSTVVQALVFPFPEIPATLTEPEARKSYLLTHYWEQFDFADTTLVNNRDVTEQGFVNFIALLLDGTTPEELTRESLANWCAGFVGKEHARQVLTQTADDYLFNPNSPFYNENLYGLYLETLLGMLPQTDAMRSSYQFKLKLVKRNNPGNRATDFTYYLPNGTRRTLAATQVKGDRLLLMFYDPECESCHEVLLQMAADTALAEAVRAGKLSVLAVYTEGNDEAWRKALPDLPKGWTVGIDHEAVKTGALYDLKAMPSLYLLDGQKTVLLKDAAYEKIRATLAL
ncbi:DUF5106 domain-containing protein [Phocaeicola barnesiae]|uniref:DUF5106 domain-containing protein n=1 Tax=Phocaeicola barnesiae TaxID=376804 RepID=A0AAW5NAK6_9BACT|nr:DUF5106 domain-containing protein [Phocaeicola barnesiae]MCF2598320.1 DUF5106 domain-containing protein [Phocaeicola barnesiae]MCR8874770.1 DUF5106 domain-containing protein [Phocaeicola barnesiae]